MEKLNPQAGGRPPRPPLPPGLLSLMLASAPRKPRRNDRGQGRPGRSGSKKAGLLPLLVLAIGSIACNPSDDTATSATVSLSFGSPGRAFAPPSAAVSSYHLDALGAEGQVQSFDSDKATLNLELAAGAWSLEGFGLSAAGERLVSGSLSLTLTPGERRSATLLLLPEGGTGSISLSWTTSGDPGPGALVEGSLGAPGEIDLAISGRGGTGSLTLASVPAGTWALELRLHGELGKLTGLADSVLVVAGCETRVQVLFEPAAARIVLSLLGPSFVSRSLALLPPLRRVSVGEGTLFTLPLSLAPGSWYLEGERVASEESSCCLLPGGEGKFRLDWVAGGGYEACSARGGLVVSAPRVLGFLAWAETLTKADLAGLAAAKSLDGCRDLAFTAEGRRLFALGRDGVGLAGFELARAPDPTLPGGGSPLPRAALTKTELPELVSPSRLAFGPAGGLMLDEGAGSVFSWSLGPEGAPSLTGRASAPELLSARALAALPELPFAFVASEASDSILLLPVDQGGLPEPFRLAARAGDPGLESFDRPYCLALSTDGSLLAAGTAGDDALYLFAVDALGGALNLVQKVAKESFLPLASLSDPVDLAFSPDGAALYVLSYFGKCLIRLDRGGDGLFVPVAAVKSGVSGALGFDYPKRLALSPDGRRALVSGGGAGDGLCLFDLTGAGGLAFVAALLPDGGDATLAKPWALAFSPDGGLLAVSSADEDRLSLYRLDP